ncbi:MAG: hypothetical protein JW971_05685 [Synergistales bacterium]|nr:hypothetical protein [Synergistales bacterium]
MKMLWITCNESVSEEIIEILDRDGVSGYSVIQDVLNKDNKRGRSHWDNAVFPGKNWSFMIFCRDENACTIVDKLREFSTRPYVQKAGIKIFMNDAEEII